jgi:hypothetical protein
MYFFDYGNAFLLESQRAGADVVKAGEESVSTSKFRLFYNRGTHSIVHKY